MNPLKKIVLSVGLVMGSLVGFGYLKGQDAVQVGLFAAMAVALFFIWRKPSPRHNERG